MDVTLLTIFLIVALVSFLGLIGGFLLVWRSDIVKRWSDHLISFAAGSILGATFLDLLPEVVAKNSGPTERIFVAALGGVILFFCLEKFLVWHHHSHRDEELPEGPVQSFVSLPWLVIIGDTVHNFLDGIIIAIAFLTDFRLGIVTAAAVVAHELPQEIGDFSILIHSGMAKRRVVWWNVASAFISPFGAIVGFTAHEAFASAEGVLLALVVGNFIYIALADLIPTIQHERRLTRSITQIGLLLLGVYAIWQLGVLLPGG